MTEGPRKALFGCLIAALTVVVANGTVYATGDDALALAPAAANGRLYLPSGDCAVYVYRLPG